MAAPETKEVSANPLQRAGHLCWRSMGFLNPATSLLEATRWSTSSLALAPGWPGAVIRPRPFCALILSRAIDCRIAPGVLKTPLDVRCPCLKSAHALACLCCRFYLSREGGYQSSLVQATGIGHNRIPPDCDLTPLPAHESARGAANQRTAAPRAS